jgi:hypothetical protein
MSYKFEENNSIFDVWWGKLVFLSFYIGILLPFMILAKKPQTPSVIIISFLVLLSLWIFIFLLLGKMTVTVNEQELTVRFGLLGWIKRKIPLKIIVSVEAVTYKPLRQFGGWGIRVGTFQGERTGCYSLSGHEGVLLGLKKEIKICLIVTRKLLIGCQNSQQLASTLH